MNDYRRGDQSGPPCTMSTLLSGSIADDQFGASSWDSHSLSAQPYDPFSSAPNSRYSPPRTVVLDNRLSGHDAQGQIPSTNGRFNPYPSYESLSSAHYADSILHDPRDFQSVNSAGHETTTRRTSQGRSGHYHAESPPKHTHTNASSFSSSQKAESITTTSGHPNRRRPMNQDEFDGPSQYLSLPLPQEDQSRTQDLPELPTHLDSQEQDTVLRRYNDVLAECAFHFIAKYQFPIPLERERTPVRGASDREWTEWAYLLKRLATKRRIPARVLHANQIKQLVTVLENSIPVRSSTPRDQHSTRRLSRDDWYLLQLVSAGVQVARILMDSLAMQQLIALYVETDNVIIQRRRRVSLPSINY